MEKHPPPGGPFDLSAAGVERCYAPDPMYGAERGRLCGASRGAHDYLGHDFVSEAEAVPMQLRCTYLLDNGLMCGRTEDQHEHVRHRFTAEVDQVDLDASGPANDVHEGALYGPGSTLTLSTGLALVKLNDEIAVDPSAVVAVSGSRYPQTALVVYLLSGVSLTVHDVTLDDALAKLAQ